VNAHIQEDSTPGYEENIHFEGYSELGSRIIYVL
jgi:hypothetical protein